MGGIDVVEKRPFDQARYFKRWKQDRNRLSTEVPCIDPPENPERRAACGQSLRLFLETYFPETTGLSPFSEDHIRVIERMDLALRTGGRQANCVYRGFAKTTITENAAIWAALYGYRECIVVFGASAPATVLLMNSIKGELEGNELLADDFPEVCAPIQCLEGKPQRCRSQVYGPTGAQTHVRWSADYVVMPLVDVPWNRSGGTVIAARGLTAASRGISIKHPDGRKVRMDFALIDDPQTDESAKSPTEVESRMSIILRGIIKSASHRKAIACVVNGTVIRANDVMDQLCDREVSPAWESERVPMIRDWPDALETLWAEYRETRHGFDPEIVGDTARAHQDATALYESKRAEMDAGCVVAWDSCYDPEIEVSAIQHALNLWMDDPPEVFAAECQQNAEEEVDDNGAPSVTPPNVLMRQVNGVPRGVVPDGRDLLTSHIDVHDRLLYWSVMAWQSDGFDGDVIDYGVWPEQPRSEGWSLRNCPKTISDVYTTERLVVRLADAIGDCISHIMKRRFVAQDTSVHRVRRLLIDCGFMPKAVETAIAKSEFEGLIEPAKGLGIGAKKKPMANYDKKRNETLGYHWRRYTPAKRRFTRWVDVDVNFWKSFFHDALKERSIHLFGKEWSAHKMFATNLTAESPSRIESKTHGQVVDEWDMRTKGQDNHYLDTVVGCCAAASIEGARQTGQEVAVKVKRKPVKLSDLQGARK
jgi:hypothetical protein